MNRFLLIPLGVMGLVLTTGCSREPAAQNLEQPAAMAPPAPSTPQRLAPAPVPVAPAATPVRSVTAADDRPRTVTTTRSKKKSAAIIGGSAAAGAAIGALAGGGKGAGIGAIAGGVGGLIYDRKTAKKTETR